MESAPVEDAEPVEHAAYAARESEPVAEAFAGQPLVELPPLGDDPQPEGKLELLRTR